MSFGPNPWQQQHWDWRAAGNFICGGAGGGLLVLSLLVPAAARFWVVLAGLALVGAGLFCVWLEIGRPLRALHVMFHPRRSWMTREAFVAALVFPCGLAVLLGWQGLAPLLALLAFAFLFCQGRIIGGSKGIPAWREPLITPLIMATGLTEGAGLLLAAASLFGGVAAWMPLLLTLLMMLRLGVWHLYRKRLAGRLAKRADAALNSVGGTLQMVGSVVPLILLAPVAAGVLPPTLEALAGLLAGVAAALPGSWMKYCLITRAGHNQGFALVKLPIRGVPRQR